MSRHDGRPRGSAPGPSSSSVPDGWEALFEPGAQERLASITAARDAGERSLAIGARLRAEGVPGSLVAALLTQSDLRIRARAKFGEAADLMLFTQAGLEQASRAPVAALHAARFARAGCDTVADLGCGIGTESRALLAAGAGVLAVEIDPFTARIAEHNLGVAWAAAGPGTEPGTGPAPARLLNCDALEAPLDGIDGAFLDPARRTAGHRDTRRLASPDDYSPSLDFAFELASRLPTGVKLGPGFERELIPDEAEAQWVSVDGQLVETGLWFGRVARPGVKRAALVMRGDATHELTAEHDASDVEPRELGAYLYEPDGAVIRARLIGLLAERLEAGMISEGIAYLTADRLVETPFAQAFRIVEQLPASEKQLRRALAERGIGRLEIKKRGADVDPAALRARLRLKGPNSGTLVLTRAAGRHIALLAERV